MVQCVRSYTGCLLRELDRIQVSCGCDSVHETNERGPVTGRVATRVLLDSRRARFVLQATAAAVTWLTLTVDVCPRTIDELCCSLQRPKSQAGPSSAHARASSSVHDRVARGVAT